MIRMPFGISSAPEVFQRINIFGDIEGIKIIFDAAESMVENYRILSKIFNKTGIRFNIDKIHYCIGSLKYISHIITSHGVTPDPEICRLPNR